jgi:hypothetical protein
MSAINSRQDPLIDDGAANTLSPEQAQVLKEAGEWQMSAGMPPFGDFASRTDGKDRLYETTGYAPGNTYKRRVVLTAETNGTQTITEYWKLGEQFYERQIYQGETLRTAQAAFEAVRASFTAIGHQDEDLKACLRGQGLLRVAIGPRSRLSQLAQRDTSCL